MTSTASVPSRRRADDSTRSSAAVDPLREINRRRVLESFSELGPLSQADLTRITGLSRTTISSIVSDLRDDGLITRSEAAETGTVGRGRGRPAAMLDLAPPSGFAAAVNFGQSHMRVAVGALTPKVLAEEFVTLDTGASGDAALDAAAETLTRVIERAGLRRSDLTGVVLGVPGPLDPTTGTIASGVILPGWTTIDPARALSRRVSLPVTAENEANLGALGEAAFGAGRGVRDLIYVGLSTGVGSGLVLSGSLHRGSTGIAGEIGHLPVLSSTRLCRCGNRGCLETVVSTPQVLSALGRSVRHPVSLDQLRELVAAADPSALRVLRIAGTEVGRVLAVLCTTLNPAAIVTGGSLGSGLGTALQDGIRDAVDEFAQPGAAAAVSILPSQLGERAGILGALALAAQESGYLLQRTASHA